MRPRDVTRDFLRSRGNGSSRTGLASKGWMGVL